MSSTMYPFLGFGIGLRAPHYEIIQHTHPAAIDWLEIITENFIEAHPGYWEFLADLRHLYPIVMHGVSLSIGSPDPLNKCYLQKVKKLADFLDVPFISDHVCWTGTGGKNTHDLLPVPYTEEALAHMSTKIIQVQECLERKLVLENPSSYLCFSASTMTEWEFLVRLTEATGCGLLLDINNVYVSAFNHHFDAKTYIDAIPAQVIAQLHLAGHRRYETHIIDTHDSYIVQEVWELYEYVCATKGVINTLVEWDEQIPPLPHLLEELEKAKEIAGGLLRKAG